METIWSSLSKGFSLTSAEQRIELVMPKGSVWRIAGHPGSVTVACVSGSVWITQEEDPEDHVLSPAERFTPDRDGQTLAMALEESRISVCRA